jgi:hypothetical protein
VPDVTDEFAIVAPVPLEHLETGEGVAKDTGYVAFGSMKWELFRDIDQRRGDAAVPVLIYPSADDSPTSLALRIAWCGLYIGSSESKGGAHVSGMRHRPSSTEKYAGDNKGHWAVFWHVSDLRRIEPAKQLPISALQTVKGGWRKNAPPRGPELVQVPDALRAEFGL